MKKLKENKLESLRGTLLLLFLLAVLGVSLGIWRTGQVQAQAGVTNPPKKIFIPMVSTNNPNDMAIMRIEVTQAVQDSQNDVPLVAGRPTILRIYTQNVGFTQAPANVKVLVTAQSTGVVLSAPSQAFATTVPMASAPESYGSTINYRLPAAWLSGTVDVTVRLDADNQFSEMSEANNAVTLHLTFNPVPPLKIMVVPIAYTDTYDGTTYPAPSRDTVSDWIMRTYPVSQVQVSWHAPLAFTGDLTLSGDFQKLLGNVTALKNTEKAPASLVYYGLIPTANGAKTWFHGGIAGLGWIGSRSAIGLDWNGQSSQIAAHEIGHNLGMDHTPCGSATNTDPHYPYTGGSIGQYGLDVTGGQLYTLTAKDMMSYCDPKWISDYTYKILYNNQKQYGAAAVIQQNAALSQAQRSLLVRANLGPQGVEMLPAYVLPGAPAESPEPGDYVVEVLGMNGEILAQTPVTAYSANEEDGMSFTAIHAMIPLSDTPAARVRLLKEGQVLAEQALQTVTMNKVAGMVVDPVETGYRVRWTASPQPALVRYTVDGGATWTTLGMDVRGSEIVIPASILPGLDGTFEVVQAGVWK